MKAENEGTRWGLPYEIVSNLGQRVHEFWERYGDCFRTQTRDSSEYARHYLCGLLRMQTHRNFSGIGQEAGISAQNLQHFMSNSPWSGDAVGHRILEELKAIPELITGGALLVDESAEEKAGDNSAGAAKQYNGRQGKIETSQVGVFLSYVNLKAPQGFWTWIKGKLFLPESWFNEDHHDLRAQLKIPNQLIFKTKVQIAWEMINEVIDQGLPFDIVSFDTFYGRSAWLRANLRAIGKTYMAEVPADAGVYLEKPELGIPDRQGARGRLPSQVRVLKGQPVRVDRLVTQLDWKAIEVRATERGYLNERFAARRVWTVQDDIAVEEWLVAREESAGKYSYALCNAASDMTQECLAWWKCQRYFIERSNQESKSELGWDELEARTYRAWEHHLAMTLLASWFIAQTKYDLARKSSRDPELLSQLKTDRLPALSVANIRDLLRAVMPLKRLTVEEATARVVEKLVNRVQSRNSRLRKLANSQQLQRASG
jgi:SRSO17 transposase